MVFSRRKRRLIHLFTKFDTNGVASVDVRDDTGLHISSNVKSLLAAELVGTVFAADTTPLANYPTTDTVSGTGLPANSHYVVNADDGTAYTGACNVTWVGVAL